MSASRRRLPRAALTASAFVTAALLPVSTALPQNGSFDPATVDLGRMVRCEMTARDYNSFAMWFTMEPDAASLLGWSPVAGNNPLLSEFALRDPLEVFGHSADAVSFTATGPMAVFRDVAPQELAASLGVVAAVDTPEKYLGEKILQQESEDVGGVIIETVVSLNVSTVDTHPGVTLAGCSYRVQVK